jgi:hypothetical protein
MTLRTIQGSKIADIVEEFVNDMSKAPEPRFTSTQLRAYVSERSKSAPGSADRIMRMLRQEKKVNYMVLNRSRGLYLALPLENPIIVGSPNQGISSITVNRFSTPTTSTSARNEAVKALLGKS